MGILDKGPETVRVWPSVVTTDDYDSPTRGPGDDHVDVDGVFAIPAGMPTRAAARYTEDVAEGDIAFQGYTFIGRGLEVCDPWAEVEWPIGSGRRWDVQGHPTVHRYPPKLAHASVRVMARAGVSS